MGFKIPEKYQVDKALVDEVFEGLEKKYREAPDPWGLDLKKARRNLELLWPLYRHYFRVRVFGQENVKEEPYIVCANHTGQLPFDAMMLTIAFAAEVKPPRILRGMVERFLAGLPFLGQFTAESGSILGDRQNCNYLLEKGESILVFPEGTRGISKNTKDFYKLQAFTKGFFRIALSTKTKILPVAIVGAEEMYPFVYQVKTLGKKLGITSVPLSPFFLLGPIGALPLPSPIDIYIGKPYEIPSDLSPDAPNALLKEHIENVENQINVMVKEGLKHRRGYFDGINFDFLKKFKELVKND